MDRETIITSSEAEWLALRDKDLTSTEAAALFGCSPYATAFDLFHRKRGQLVVEFETNDRMKWGNRLESAIAMGIAEDHGLVVEPFKAYMRIPSLRMGSSFDFKITGLAEGFNGDETFRDLFREHGEGIMEVKNVDGLQFRRAWIADGEDMEAPPHIELQVQHQQEVADLEWTIVAPLVGGNTPRPFARLRDRAVGKMIVERVTAFWAQVDSGRAPEPDYAQDAGTIAKLLYQDNGQEIDLSENERLAELADIHAQASADEKAAKERKDAAKAESLMIIGHAAKVMGSGFKISASTNKGSAGTLITPDMIGQRIGGRAGFRNFRIYPVK